MPIVASKSADIQKRLGDLKNPDRREAAVLRLRAMGTRVLPHIAREMESFDAAARIALVEVLNELDTKDAKALLSRMKEAMKGERRPADRADDSARAGGEEARALDELRRLPPPLASEAPGTSRNRGEAHLVLARLGSRLARKELAQSLATRPPARLRAYCEAAALIADATFLDVLARVAESQPDALTAIRAIAVREGLSARSAVLRKLEVSVRNVVAKAMTQA